MKKGLLIINLGTPKGSDAGSVRAFLAEFLTDERVITVPAPIRFALVYGAILPFRPRKVAKAYQAIWTEDGSPLLVHSKALANKLQQRLVDTHKVALGMRYGEPCIASALKTLEDCETLTILPLYPQYSSAATGSSIEKALTVLAKKSVIPSVRLIRDFHVHPSYIKAQAECIKPYISNHDHLLLSYHGIPENHILQGACKTLCVNGCNANSVSYAGCYRAQCYKTTEALAQTLGLTRDFYSLSFQSRLGRTPWIQPFTDEILESLRSKGIKRLAVACPSFVADCLETLEEIGMRAKELWEALGGETLTLIPCLNEDEAWIDAVVDLAKF